MKCIVHVFQKFGSYFTEGGAAEEAVAVAVEVAAVEVVAVEVAAEGAEAEVAKPVVQQKSKVHMSE